MRDTFRHRPRGCVRYLSLALALAALPAAAAEGDAEYREHVMEAIGGHMQSAAAILRRKVPHQAHLQLHAAALADLAGIADTLFPEGSGGGDALPAIWENRDDFAERLQAFQTAASELRGAVSGGGDIGGAFQQVGQACKACHDDYRAE